MDFAVLATVFGIVFVAELPDKTALASLVLGTKYRPTPAFVGVAVAFAVHVVLAIIAGSMLGLLPHRAVEAVVGVLFAVGAVLMFRRRDDDTPSAAHPDTPADVDTATETHAVVGQPHANITTRARVIAPGFLRVAVMSFAVLVVAEFGDLTQIVTANLAAQYHQPLAVGIGATLGLWAVGGLAIIGGRQLLRLIPLSWIVRTAAAVMATMAVISLIAAITD